MAPYIETKKDELKDSWGKPFHYTPTPGGEHEYELIFLWQQTR